ncbi:MAG: MBL fold metallo-hydrolase [Deltaproteobacteria bacterium]|nr:MBL fold metallo-hydrolase [Deltaproteobacteria bacterium]
MSFWVRFWGVRGSIACPTPRHIAFGGNTSCIEVEADGHRIILDAGSGIRELGESFVKRGIQHAHILLTHTHWDHINGFPFFGPSYDPACSFVVKAGHLSEMGGVRQILAGQMATPMFPVPLETLRANMSFEDFRAGETFDIGSLEIQTAALNHPQGATAYRINCGGKSVCYVTDTEHVPGKHDENILELIDGSDLVIYDSTYTDAEFPEKVGWGHSTWQEGVRLSQRANVKQLAIFHHAPEHEDAFMENVEREAQAAWDGAFVARERMRITLI